MPEPTVPVVAVDGPSGVGKGTIARRLAVALGFRLLDSGALYRLVALAAARSGVSLSDSLALERVAEGLDARFEAGNARRPLQVLLAGEDVAETLRTEACGRDASVVAAVPGVRAALLERQRGFRRPPGLVADGRDMGTVVFPDAVAKIYLIASARERARRRYKQLIEQGISANLDTLFRDISARDLRDGTREVAPLEPAGDAVVIDTDDLDVEGVHARAMEIVARALHGS